MILIILSLITLFNPINAIVGFDCGSTNPIINTYSLLDTGECDFQRNNLSIINTTVELLQLAEFRSIHVIQCKIEIKRTVFHCGMFSHLGPTENGEQEYIYDISHEKCKFIYETGIFKYDNSHTISDLKINSTTSVGIEFAGKVEDKSCSGAAYTDRFGSWNNVYVPGIVKITLRELYAQVSLNSDKIRLNSGTVCKFSEQHCIDIESGYAFWSLLPNNNCFNNKYDILYRGTVTRISSPGQETVYIPSQLKKYQLL